jgi:hypothetical protein
MPMFNRLRILMDNQSTSYERNNMNFETETWKKEGIAR